MFAQKTRIVIRQLEAKLLKKLVDKPNLYCTVHFNQFLGYFY